MTDTEAAYKYKVSLIEDGKAVVTTAGRAVLLKHDHLDDRLGSVLYAVIAGHCTQDEPCCGDVFYEALLAWACHTGDAEAWAICRILKALSECNDERLRDVQALVSRYRDEDERLQKIPPNPKISP